MSTREEAAYYLRYIVLAFLPLSVETCSSTAYRNAEVSGMVLPHHHRQTVSACVFLAPVPSFHPSFVARSLALLGFGVERLSRLQPRSTARSFIGAGLKLSPPNGGRAQLEWLRQELRQELQYSRLELHAAGAKCSKSELLPSAATFPGTD